MRTVNERARQHTSVQAACLAAFVAAALAGAPAPKPAALTAEQVLEKSIAATGGRQALESVTSTVAMGELEMLTQHAHALIEYYAQAPAQRLIVTRLEGFGVIRQGCDGASAWIQNADLSVREFTGEEKEATLRECAFHAEIKWRDLYPKVALAGKEKVGARPAYKIVMTPASGPPVTRFIDAETFLLIRQVSTRESAQGAVTIQADMSDYRDVGGVKVPFLIHQKMPGQEVLVKMLSVENNVPIDVARFARPAEK